MMKLPTGQTCSMSLKHSSQNDWPEHILPLTLNVAHYTLQPSLIRNTSGKVSLFTLKISETSISDKMVKPNETLNFFSVDGHSN